MARRNTAIAKDQDLELSANALRAEKTMHFPVSTDVKSTNTTNQPMEGTQHLEEFDSSRTIPHNCTAG